MKCPLTHKVVRTWALPCLAVVVAGLWVGAPQARAQIQVGCAKTFILMSFPCSDIVPGCGDEEYVVYEPYAQGNESWYAVPQPNCCGYGVWEHFPDGTCESAAPQSQVAAGKANAVQVAHADTRRVANGGPSGFRHEPQPVYIRDCRGKYFLYVAPLSP